MMLFVFCSFCAGLCGWYGGEWLFKRVRIWPSFWPYPLQQLERAAKSNASVAEPAASPRRRGCSVCSDQSCTRMEHTTQRDARQEDEAGLVLVPEPVNESLERLVERWLDVYINSWYDLQLQAGVDFRAHVKEVLQYVAAVVASRLQKADLFSIVEDEIIPLFVTHIHLAAVANRGRKCSLGTDTLLLYASRRKLHFACLGPEQELAYIRGLSEKLCELLLPANTLLHSSQHLLREVVAMKLLRPLLKLARDPALLRRLIVRLAALKRMPRTPPPPPVSSTPLLGGVYASTTCNQTPLALSFSDIVSSTQKHFAFQNFLERKHRHAFFMWAVFTDFAKLIEDMKMEKPSGQLVQTLQSMYHNNFDYAAGCKVIPLPINLQNRYESLLGQQADSLGPMRAAPPDSFEVADLIRDLHTHFATVLVPLLTEFNSSRDLFAAFESHRFAGGSDPHRSALERYRRAQERANRRHGSIDFYDGVKLEDETPLEEAQLLTGAGDHKIEKLKARGDEDANSLVSYEEPSGGRDLSLWRVSIPSVDSVPDPDNNKKELHRFIIQVQKVDDSTSSWQLSRLYSQFYELQRKLTQFHCVSSFGGDTMLPSRRVIGTRDRAFVDSQRKSFEQYLQHLLEKPALRCSELIFNFLSTEQGFDSPNIMPSVTNIIKAVNKVPSILRSATGLDQFLVYLATSVEPEKARPGPWGGDSDSGVSVEAENGEYWREPQELPSLSTRINALEQLELVEEHLPTSIWSLAQIFIRSIADLSLLQKKVLAVVTQVGAATVEDALRWTVRDSLEQAARYDTICTAVELVETALFGTEPAPPLPSEDEVLESLEELLPPSLKLLLGADQVNTACHFLNELVGKSSLNEQMTYSLLHTALAALFPELNEATSDEECFS